MGEIVKKGSHTTAKRATRGFDLDDIGAQITHEFAAELAFFVGELQDSQAR
jgi:hypothetical protein